MSETHPHTEPDRVSAKPVLLTVVAFFGFVGVCLVVLYFYFISDVGRRPFLHPSTFPAPQLQVTPRADLEGLKTGERARLQGYGWVDKDRGIVRVPIERAMEIIAGKGKDGLAPLTSPPSPQQSASEKAAQAERQGAQPLGGRQ